MKLTNNIEVYTDLVRWYRKVKAQPYKKSVNSKLNETIKFLDGNHGLYLGLPEFRRKFESGKFLSFLSLDGKDILEHQLTERRLPFEDKSHDVIILLHALDLHDNPYNFIREINRVASDDARVLIVGFNKISLWGLIRQVYNKNHSPWSLKFHSSSNIKEWFKILGYEVTYSSTSCFFPFTSKNISKYFEKFNFIQKWFFSQSGGIYFYVFEKKVLPLTPQKVKFKNKYITSSFPKSTVNRIR